MPLRHLISLGATAKGALLSFAVTLFAALLMGLAVSITEWEGFSSGIEDGFAYVAVALGGMLAAKSSRHLGWLHGALVGLIFVVAASALFQSDFTWSAFLTTAWLAQAFWHAAAGALGGVLGVNV